VARFPTLIPLLERLAALLMPVMPTLGTMALCNIYWALGFLRFSPAGGCNPCQAQECELMHASVQSCTALLHFFSQLPSPCRPWRFCAFDDAEVCEVTAC
jgi:hypothetical protein